MTATYSLEADPSSVEVSSGSATLIFNTLTTGAINVESGQTTFGFQNRVELASGAVEVRSSSATLSSPSLVGLTGSIAASSGPADLRLVAGGYSPSTAPTTRSFQPPSYRVEKTTAMNGRVVRQIMCSKPSDALLTLEYVNVSDTYAEEVLTAYDQSYGTRFGFALSPEVLRGAGTDLLNYINLNGSNLKWYYASAPSVESVIKGICNLSVQLRGKLVPSEASYTPAVPPNQISAVSSVVNVSSASADLTLIPAPVVTDPNFASVTLLLHMDGSNGSTTFTDSSNDALAVSVSTGTVSITTADSQFGGASADFTAGGMLVTATSNGFTFPGDFTVELWVKRTGTTGLYDTILSGSHESQIMIRPDGANPGVYFNATLFATNLSLTTNVWHHLAVVRSGSTITAYKDGVAIGSMTSTYTLVCNFLRLGDSSVSGRYFKGRIDEVRVTKNLARYTANFTPPSAPFPNS